MTKTIMLTLLLAIGGLTGFSQQKRGSLQESQIKIPLASFDQLTIDGNFKLTLVECDNPSIHIKGNPRFVNAFKLHLGNKNLVVRTPYIERGIDNNEVIMYVNKLKTMIVLQDAVINIVEMSMAENLKVLLESECLIKVKKEDVNKIRASENFDLEISNDPKRQN
ncbi:MAG: DUF2807 domain-containing protein [Ferruginibacter sp.]|nr:DUF2807 domain-containing protein [Ferruginibacter sp.]